jgi:peptidoglycan/LPS O-acetylase OafA/YrhL
LGHRWIVALLSVLLLVPAIVSLGLESRIGGGLSKACLALGALSYPLYLIHDPLASIVASWIIHSGHSGLLRIGAMIFAPSVVLLAWAVHQWVDMPVRAWLTRTFSKKWAPAGAVIPASTPSRTAAPSE